MSSFKSKLLLVIIFTFVWLITFNAAYVNGDDVVYMVGKYGNGIFLVNPNDYGIPNRLFDSYFRGLSTALFDSMYFPVKLIYDVNFFYFYKFYTATVFASFITYVSSFFIKESRSLLFQFHGDRKLVGFESLLLDIFISGIVIYVFPWKNQVHLICYQIPAFLGLVIALKLIEGSIDNHLVNNYKKNASVSGQFLIISLLFAFSLEVYTLSMCVFCVIWGFTQYRLRSIRAIKSIKDFLNEFRSFGRVVLVFTLCTISICIGIFRSSRVQQGFRDDLSPNLLLKFSSSEEGLYVGAMLVAFIGILAIVRISSAKNGFPGPSEKRGFDYILGLLAMFVSQILVVALISLLSGVDYFSSRQYPWGDFLLTLKCALILALFVQISVLLLNNGLLQMFVNIAVFIFSTKLIFDPLFSSHNHYRESRLLKSAYDQMALGKSGVFDSGMNLEIILMGIKPLPQRDSPDWFKDSYKRFFNKYYDVNTSIYFW